MSTYMRSTFDLFLPTCWLHMPIIPIPVKFCKATKLPHACWPLLVKKPHNVPFVTNMILLFYRDAFAATEWLPNKEMVASLLCLYLYKNLPLTSVLMENIHLKFLPHPFLSVNNLLIYLTLEVVANNVFLLQLHMMFRGPQFLVSEMIVRSLWLQSSSKTRQPEDVLWCCSLGMSPLLMCSEPC